MVKSGSRLQIKQKINILERAADALEGGTVKYYWKHTARCNCGVLAQCALREGDRKLKIRLKGIPYNISWRGLVGKFPSQTVCHPSWPLRAVFEALYGHGFTPEELTATEYLADPEILAQWPRTMMPVFNNPADTVTYFRVWAKMLKKVLRQRHRRQLVAV